MKHVRSRYAFGRGKVLKSRAVSIRVRRELLVSLVVLSLISVLLISNMRGILA